MAVTNGWGQGVINNTNGFGKLATNTINEGAIYENSYSGDTALIGTSAAFAYGKSSYNQGEADPTPTITGTAGGSFNADAGVVFVDTGSFNSSTGQIDLSATTIDSHIITYTVDGVQSGQTVGVTSLPYSSTSSFSFDGVDDYFDLGTDSTLEFTNNFSISLWIKETTLSLNRGVIVCGDFTNNSQGWKIQRTSTDKIAFNCAARTATSTTSINTGDWFHVLATWETAVGGGIGNRNRIYINGILEGTSTTGVAFSPTYMGTIHKQIAYPYNTIGNEFSGNIDEVSMWNTALSSDAITEIASGPSELTSLTYASSSNLKAWYKMGE